jgi:hypothetical protein
MKIINNTLLSHSITDEKFKAAYQNAIEFLSVNDFSHGLNFKKLNHSSLFSIRLGRGARILIAKVKIKIIEGGQEKEVDYLLPLEFFKSHKKYMSAIGKFTPANINKAINSQLERLNLVESGMGLQAKETDLSDQSDQYSEALLREMNPIELTFYDDKILALDEAQQEAVKLRLPSLITGLAGSGKTLVALSMLERLREEFAPKKNEPEKPPLLYVAPTKALAEHVKSLWEALPASGAHLVSIEFKSSDELLSEVHDGKELTNDAELETWLWTMFGNKNKSKKNKKGKNNEPKGVGVERLSIADSNEVKKIVQEFQLISDLSKEDYLTVGRRLSYFDRGAKERALLYKAYEEYQRYLIKQSKVHSRLTLFPESAMNDKRYSGVIVDEAQKYGIGFLSSLKARADNDCFCLLGDPHQASRALSLMSYMKDHLVGGRHTALPLVHRYSAEVARAANRVLDLQRAVLDGGEIDSVGVSEVKTPDNADIGALYQYDTVEQCREAHLPKGRMSVDTVIITLPEHAKEAREKFNTALVLTPEEAAGLEYPTVVVYKLFEPSKAWFKSIAMCSAGQDLKKGSGHRLDKQAFDEIPLESVGFLNRLFTAFTRAKGTLIICEAKEHPASKSVLEFLHLDGFPPKIYEEKEQPPAEDVRLKETVAWVSEALRQDSAGNVEVAQNIYQEVFAQYPDISLSLREVFEGFMKSNPKSKEIKTFIGAFFSYINRNEFNDQAHFSFVCLLLEYVKNEETDECITQAIVEKLIEKPKKKDKLSHFARAFVFAFVSDIDNVYKDFLELFAFRREKFLSREQSLFASMTLIRAVAEEDGEQLKSLAIFDVENILRAFNAEIYCENDPSMKACMGRLLSEPEMPRKKVSHVLVPVPGNDAHRKSLLERFLETALISGDSDYILGFFDLVSKLLARPKNNEVFDLFQKCSFEPSKMTKEIDGLPGGAYFLLFLKMEVLSISGFFRFVDSVCGLDNKSFIRLFDSGLAIDIYGCLLYAEKTSKTNEEAKRFTERLCGLDDGDFVTILNQTRSCSQGLNVFMLLMRNLYMKEALRPILLRASKIKKDKDLLALCPFPGEVDYDAVMLIARSGENTIFPPLADEANAFARRLSRLEDGDFSKLFSRRSNSDPSSLVQVVFSLGRYKSADEFVRLLMDRMFRLSNEDFSRLCNESCPSEGGASLIADGLDKTRPELLERFALRTCRLKHEEFFDLYRQSLKGELNLLAQFSLIFFEKQPQGFKTWVERISLLPESDREKLFDLSSYITVKAEGKVIPAECSFPALSFVGNCIEEINKALQDKVSIAEFLDVINKKHLDDELTSIALTHLSEIVKDDGLEKAYNEVTKTQKFSVLDDEVLPFVNFMHLVIESQDNEKVLQALNLLELLKEHRPDLRAKLLGKAGDEGLLSALLAKASSVESEELKLKLLAFFGSFDSPSSCGWPSFWGLQANCKLAIEGGVQRSSPAG